MYAAGIKKIIATRGSYGALYYDGVGFFSQPPKLVNAIDTLGAGDSFAAAFLLSFTESMERESEKMTNDRTYYETELKKALEAGAEFASKTCMVQGAFGHGRAFE